MATKCQGPGRFEFFFSTFFLPLVVRSATDASDVGALQVLYTSLNCPSQLVSWRSSDGDPCKESWEGVTCEGSSVVSIQISGLQLHGTMGYLLSNLISLRRLDLSDNFIHDSIPYQLPPNLTSLNLARNNLSGNLPYSIHDMLSLTYMNLSHNLLSQSIGDIFANLVVLKVMDLSFNNFVGELPTFNFGSNLSTLYVQNNQLTGTLNVLMGLPLTTLNVANNQFNGQIPQEFHSIPIFIFSGNSFAKGLAPHTMPPPGRFPNNGTLPGFNGHTPTSCLFSTSNKRLTHGIILGATLSFILLVVFALLTLAFWVGKNKKDMHSTISSTTTLHDKLKDPTMKHLPPITEFKSLQTENLAVERLQGISRSISGVKPPIAAASYTVASLQAASSNFSQECLIGEGSLGRVYKAVFPNGKIMAIKKVDMVAMLLRDENMFLEAVSTMSRLRHANIVSLVGYCAEQGQRFLLYEYIGNQNLHDNLHCVEDESKVLPWNTRVRIALGTARALEYLHEICLPSIVYRNLKSANILLDEDLHPHLSDCGLASLSPSTARQVSSHHMAASFGYSAPESAMSGSYTVRSDVYSFGVVMLELLTRRKPLDRERLEPSLVRWASPQLHDMDALTGMVDPSLNGMYPAKSLWRFADIIAQCIQAEPEFRPPMSEVVQALMRLAQRSGTFRSCSSVDGGVSFRTPEHDAGDLLFFLPHRHGKSESSF